MRVDRTITGCWCIEGLAAGVDLLLSPLVGNRRGL